MVHISMFAALEGLDGSVLWVIMLRRRTGKYMFDPSLVVQQLLLHSHPVSLL